MIYFRNTYVNILLRELRIFNENDKIVAECAETHRQYHRMEFNMKILVFAGTTEGRRIAEYLNGTGADIYVSAATEYGGRLLEEYQNLHLLTGRMDEDEITAFLNEREIDLAVDATHPFAVLVTGNIKRACDRAGVQYLRCLREEEHLSEDMELVDNKDRTVIQVNSVKQAVEYLNSTKGNIFISTGSKELGLYTGLEDYKERCYARVLSVWESVKKSMELGFDGKHLIAMQGPFSKELNIAMLRQTKADYFVTKESGKTGGFEEKYEAAKETGTVLVVVERPEEEGFSVEQVCQKIEEQLADSQEG